MTQDPAPDEAAPLSTAELVLLGDRLCPFLQRIAIVLNEKQAPYDLAFVDAAAKQEHCSSALADAWQVLLVKDRASSAAALARLRSTLERLEGALAGPYFAGAGFCMVDAFMAPVFRYFDVLLDPAVEAIIDGLPSLLAWRRALAARPSVKAAVTRITLTAFAPTSRGCGRAKRSTRRRRLEGRVQPQA